MNRGYKILALFMLLLVSASFSIVSVAGLDSSQEGQETNSLAAIWSYQAALSFPSFKLPYEQSSNSNAQVQWTGGPHSFGHGYQFGALIPEGLGSGMDFSNGGSFEVLAMASGTVVEADCESNGGLGCIVAIQHDQGGTVMIYGHMTQPTLAVDTWVPQGRPIGFASSTGMDPAEAKVHLHIELRDGAKDADGNWLCSNEWYQQTYEFPASTKMCLPEGLGGRPIGWGFGEQLNLDGYQIWSYVMKVTGSEDEYKERNYDGSATRGGVEVIYGDDSSALTFFAYEDNGTLARPDIVRVASGFRCMHPNRDCELPENQLGNLTRNTQFARDDGKSGNLNTASVLRAEGVTAGLDSVYGAGVLVSTNVARRLVDTIPASAFQFNVSISDRYATLTPTGVSDNAGGSGVREVRYSAKWAGQWTGIGVVSSHPYALTWDMCAANVPSDLVEFGMEIWDHAGNQWVWSEDSGNKNPTIVKSYNCVPAATEQGVYLYRSTGASGSEWCRITEDAPSITNACGGGWNDNIKSISTVGEWSAVLFYDDNYVGGSSILDGPDNDLGNQAIGYQTSSLRVRRRSPATFTLFLDGDNSGAQFTSDRTIRNLADWGFNDKAKSIWLEPGYEALLCVDWDFHGACGRTNQSLTDIGAANPELRPSHDDARLSSIRICPGTCPQPPNAPTIVAPLHSTEVDPNEVVVFSWTGAATQYRVSYWKEGEPATTTGWFSGTQWSPGQLLESNTRYHWRVQSWNEYGDGGWSPDTPFYVRNTKAYMPPIYNPDELSTISIVWSPLSWATDYELQQALSVSLTSDEILEYLGSEQVGLVTGYVHAGQYNARNKICYRVRGLSSEVTGAWSTPQCTVARVIYDSAPTLARISNADGNGNFSVEWTGIQDASNYILEETYNGDVQNYDLAAYSKSFSAKAEGKWCYRVRGATWDYLYFSLFSNRECTVVNPPLPDLKPERPGTEPYPPPIVLDNVSGNTPAATPTLFAGKPAYLDYFFHNIGNFTASGPFNVNILIDNVLQIYQSFAGVEPGNWRQSLDQAVTVATEGNHTVKIVVDSGNTVNESNEANNSYEQVFTWSRVNGWYGEYYNNSTLSGLPKFVRDDPTINFVWSGSPASGVIADGFSVRWTRTDTFETGTYRFEGFQDDGARLKIDGETVYEQWNHPTRMPFEVTKTLTSGQHTIIYETYDYTGTAEASLIWELLAPVPPTNVQASDSAYPDKVQITWSDVPSTHYEVYRADSVDGLKTFLGTAVSEWFDNFALTVGQMYYYWVKACQNTLCSPFSNYDTGMARLGVPTLNLLNHADGDGNYSVNWTTVPNASSYELQEQYNSGSWTTAQTSATTTKAFTGKNNGTWCYRSRAVAGAASGNWSTPQCVVTWAVTGSLALVSRSTGGIQGNGVSYSPALSADGRFVAFESVATNLVAGDTNGREDVFVRDLNTGITNRVSVSSAGVQAGSDSWGPAISSDGRFVAFYSWALNLVTGDTNNAKDVFVHDRSTGTTTRVSVSSAGIQGNADSSGPPDISADGRLVVFEAVASNLVSGDTNGVTDIFVHDRQTGTTTRASVGTNSIQGDRASFNPVISGNGRFVAFTSDATNLVPMDTNGTEDVFVRDLLTGTTTRASLNSSGGQGVFAGDASISDDGRFVAFGSPAAFVPEDTNGESDVYVRDVVSGTTERVSVNSAGLQANRGSFYPAVSADGQFVVFQSFASNLDGNSDTGIFVHNREAGSTARISLDKAGGAGPFGSPVPAISTDSRFIAFAAGSVNLIPGNPDGLIDVIVYARPTLPVLGSITNPNRSGNYSVSWSGVAGATGYEVREQANSGNWNIVYNGVATTVAITSRAAGTWCYQARAFSPMGFGPWSGQECTEVASVAIQPVFLSSKGIGTISGKSFTGADVLSYVKATNTWDVFYDGSYVKTAKNVGAFTFQGDDILLGFSAAQIVPGLGATAAPQDLIRFTPTRTGYNNTAGTFGWFFDGSDVGLTTSGEIIDALWIDTVGRLYISVTVAGEVPRDSAVPTGAKFKFQDEDVLRFTPRTTGATTSGTWELYWDPTGITNMPAEDVNGYWEDPATGDRYITILGAFKIGNAAYGGVFSGNGTTILRFVPNAAAPGGWAPAEKVTWLAAGGVLPAKFGIDGIEMSR